jgi:hypothetical protein
MGGYPPQGVPKGVTKHTELTDKEVAGVIDHADGSVTDGKLASGVGLSDGQICKLPAAVEGKILRRGAVAWEAGDVPAPSVNEILEAMARFKGSWWFNNNWLPAGMVHNAVLFTGNIEWSSDNVRLSTGTTVGSYAFLQKICWAFTPNGLPTWDKKRYLGVVAYFETFSNQNIHLVVGRCPIEAENPLVHIGFKLIDDTLYGTVGDGTGESTLYLETLTVEGFKKLECILDPELGECRFYVDDVYKGAITTHLPSGDADSEDAMQAIVYNKEAADKSFYIDIWRFLQYE